LVICAEERFSPSSGPKSSQSFQAGLRASGNSSTRVIRLYEEGLRVK